jgi:hypothetical protein
MEYKMKEPIDKKDLLNNSDNNGVEEIRIIARNEATRYLLKTAKDNAKNEGFKNATHMMLFLMANRHLLINRKENN